MTHKTNALAMRMATMHTRLLHCACARRRRSSDGRWRLGHDDDDDDDDDDVMMQ